MRIFRIKDGGAFEEIPSQEVNEEKTLEDWLESNPDSVLEDDDPILIIGRQVRDEDLGGYIDLLGLDRQGNTIVIELKRDRTPRDTIAQALEYASFVERLDIHQLDEIFRSYTSDSDSPLGLAEHHREHFKLDGSEAVAFNKDQRIVVVGQSITPRIRQTASFLRTKGIKCTCIELAFFQKDDHDRFLSREIVVGEDSGGPVRVASASSPRITEAAFLESLDENGRAVFSRVLELAGRENMPVHWGTKGFSLNVDVNGTHVAICYGYPPNSIYKQTFWTAVHYRAGMEGKTDIPEDVLQALNEQARATGLFEIANQNQDLKCFINRQFTEAEIDSLLKWCVSAEQAIRKYGLKLQQAAANED